MSHVDQQKKTESELSLLTPEQRVASTCTSLNLKRAARAASSILDEHLQPAGLRASQFGVLSAISRACSTTITNLADALVADRTTLTRNLKLLQRDGLVKVVPGRDRRVREVALTDEGRRALAQALPLWECAEAAIRERLGAARWHRLLEDAAAMSALAEGE